MSRAFEQMAIGVTLLLSWAGILGCLLLMNHWWPAPSPEAALIPLGLAAGLWVSFVFMQAEADTSMVVVGIAALSTYYYVLPQLGLL